MKGLFLFPAHSEDGSKGIAVINNRPRNVYFRHSGFQAASSRSVSPMAMKLSNVWVINDSKTSRDSSRKDNKDSRKLGLLNPNMES